MDLFDGYFVIDVIERFQLFLTFDATFGFRLYPGTLLEIDDFLDLGWIWPGVFDPPYLILMSISVNSLWQSSSLVVSFSTSSGTSMKVEFSSSESG